MRTLDFAPLYRSTVGFDHLSQLLDSIVQREQSQPSYPPYNIERLDKDQYRITMAVAGFTEDELSIQSEQQTLKVTGKKQADDKSRTYLHQGIAARNFERVFQLADHVKVTDAQMENGLLHIELEREVPEAMKPRQIPIGRAEDKLIQGN
ncbi:heat-shock protein IbpA [Pseudohongiella nitratireducens]|uniref:Heat-shock protein IbpA n=1 Tax=Pseudohongiella nitratireducens TaxID=1768907 RepID=A0A917GIP6_9GAMM|nr:Hsp20 family protein [Pseudohongiella nitratireducens]MDF1624506.1 Hsp20 family protein [Pseudohongiella nitratireducens]GGG48020.1 heat-shock protein IbpA [Pseudohongiella nitratireducens]